jgi:uncharacterized protein involved in outer membrane biogenesis
MGLFRGKKGWLVLSGAGILLVAVVAFYFLALPRLINSQALKTRIQVLAQQQLGAEVDFKRLELHLLPRPNVKLVDAVLSIPPDIRATAAALRIYPEILPLFSGKVRIAAADLESCGLTLTIPDLPAGGKVSIVETRKRLEALMAALLEMKIPRLKLRILHSRFNLRIGRRKVLELTRINGDLSGTGEQREMSFRCTSPLWREVSIRASLHVGTFAGKARIRFSRLRPRQLVAHLFPDAGFQVEGEPVSIEMRLQSDGPTRLRAQMEGSVPSLKLRRSGQIFDIRCPAIKGSLAVTGEVIDLALSQVSLTHPAMDLSARLTLNPDTPRVALQVEGRQVDVKALRRMALGLLGNSETVRGIFNVVRGGRVPRITVASEGKSPAELGDMHNLVIRGEMQAGEIHVPSGQLDLKETSGRAVISKGILVGKDLSARLGNSKGAGGTLRLGLVGDERPFHLDIGVQADLSDLPPVLGKLVNNHNFQRQLAMLREFKGSARGRLVLGESTDDVNVTADVDSFHLDAHYQPIPFPVKVSAGSCSYRDTGFKVGGLAGSLGTSSFTGLNGALDWQKAPYLQIGSGKLDVVLKDLLPWLSSFRQLAGLQQYYTGGKGVLALASLSLKGPLFSPRQWRFATSGRIADLVLNVPSPSAPMAIASTAFTADNHEFSYTDARIQWLDAKLKVSGRHRDYLKHMNKNGHLSIKGRLGPRTLAWLSQHTLLPARIKLRPLTLSAAHLDWDERGKTALVASVATDKGGRVSLDLVYSPDELNMRKLLIDDGQSHAAIGFVLRGKSVDFSFEGNLTKASMDWILARNDILNGSVKGSFKTHIDVDHPYDSTAQGRLEGTNLNSVWGFGIPVKIHRFSLSADGSRIALASSEFSWHDNSMQLSGEVSYGARKIAADLHLTSDEIRGDELFKALAQGGQKPEGGPAQISLPSTITGRLRVDTARFLYGGLTWEPVQADLSLSAKGLDIDVTRANLCGIATPGTIHISPQRVIEVDFRPAAANQQLGETLPCLYGDKIRLEGRYDLNARISGRVAAGELIRALRGNLEYEAHDGRFYYDTVLLTVLDYLNAEKIISDHVRDVRREGRAFRLISIRARLADDKVIVEEMEMDSEDIKLAGEGVIGLADHSLNFNLLVAVVKTVNRVVGKVPLLGGIFDDMLSVPVKVKGDWENPHVRPLAPSAVGAELTGIMKKIVTLGREEKRP